jgi:hypothetical protein
MGLVALPLHATASDGYQLVVVDLGYSASSKSCGVAFSSSDPCEETFGRTVNVVRERIGAFRRNPGGKPLLVLEAPLSCFHSANGNPGVRGGIREWAWLVLRRWGNYCPCRAALLVRLE